jgi:hypothetical protein
MNEDKIFLYCHDPLDLDSGEYLLHLADPYGLIRMLSLDEEDPVETNEFIHKTYFYETPEGDEEEYQLVFTSFNTRRDQKQGYPAEAIFPILDNAWEYWVQILETTEEDDDL